MRRGTDEQKMKKIEKRGWWHFSAVCVSGSWECMVYPGLLERTPVWAIWVPGEPDFPTCRLVSYIFHHLLFIIIILFHSRSRVFLHTYQRHYHNRLISATCSVSPPYELYTHYIHLELVPRIDSFCHLVLKFECRNRKVGTP